MSIKFDRCVGYICTELEGKASKAEIARQKALIEVEVKRIDGKLLAIYADHGSTNTSRTRKGLSLIIDAVKRGEIDYIVVENYDILGDHQLYEEIKKCVRSYYTEAWACGKMIVDEEVLAMAEAAMPQLHAYRVERERRRVLAHARDTETGSLIDSVYEQTKHLPGADFVDRLKDIGIRRGYLTPDDAEDDSGDTSPVA